MSVSALRTVLALESPWVRFLDVLLLYQTVLFVLLIYLILLKSGHMPYYRWCLLVNVTSIYVVVVGCFLGKPLVLAEGFFVPLGIISKLGPRVHFYCLLSILFPICCHGLALIFRISYQAMQVPSWFSRAAEPVAAWLFRTKVRFFGTYFALAFGMWTLGVVFFLQARVDFGPFHR